MSLFDMGLFDGLFPASKESESALFSTDSIFRRHATKSEETSNKEKNLTSASSMQQGMGEKQVCSRLAVKCRPLKHAGHSIAPQ